MLHRETFDTRTGGIVVKKKVIVLGCGLVGSVMALDLAADDAYEVTVADANEEALKKTAAKAKNPVKTTTGIDFASPASITEGVRGHDLVIGAVPGSMGYAAIDAVIKAGVDMSDISFMGEEYRDWDRAAKEAGVTLFEDVGVTPGASSILIGDACRRLDRVDDVTIYVTGLPKSPEPPFNYRLVFSPDDLVEEFVRPARIKRNGKIVEEPALSGRQLLTFDIPGISVPQMEGFYTDGARSLLDSIPCPDVKEITLRYPGTARDMEFLREIGLFDTDPVDVKGQKVAPRDLFATLAYPKMKLRDDEIEFTFFHVLVTGEKDGKKIREEYALYDERDPGTGYHSMARTTGFPCVIVGRLIAEGVLRMPGVNPPEAVGTCAPAVERFLQEMAKRGVKIIHRVTEL